jgi:Trk K+ transport system NAD-binding subunit
MNTWQRRTAYSLVALLVLVLLYTVVYQAGMAAFETPPGEPAPTYLHALQVVVETFTTTGFGSDAPWNTPQMNLLVVLMDLTGVALIFLALPVLVFPMLEETLSTSPPVEADLTDHVVVCTYTPRADPLISELDSWEVPHVVVEPDRERAIDLHEEGYEVVHADPESVEGLRRVDVSEARAVVADVSDTVDASIVLAAREVDDDVSVYSLVEAQPHVTYHRLAGADSVFTPRSLLARSLAGKVTTAVSADLGGAVDLDGGFEIAELPIRRESALDGETLATSGIRERTGANVIGAWRGGNFVTPPDPETPCEPGTVLLVTGHPDQIEALNALTQSRAHSHDHDSVLIVGHGEVGGTVADSLAEAGVEHTVLDRVEEEGVDVVGDGTEAEALSRAGVEDADTVVLALPDDTDSVFAALVVRDLNPEAQVLARAQDDENVAKMYRAGADYVLALSTVSGRMLASAILDEESVVSFDKQVEVVRTTASRLRGQTLAEADVRNRTGCTVVAVEREGEILTDVGPEFRVTEGDELVVAGTDEGTNRLNELLN